LQYGTWEPVRNATASTWALRLTVLDDRFVDELIYVENAPAYEVRGSLRLPALSPASPLQVAGMCVRSAARLWSGSTRQATVLEVAVGDRRVRGAERLMDQYRRCGGLKTTRCRPLSAQPVGWKPLRQIRGPPSRQSSLSASLSFSLIRGHSLGFAIGRHACIGRRQSGLNIDERPRAD
jgi:hypothetical protein